LNQLGYDVTGVDLSKQSIDAANTHSNDRLKFSVHDMRKPMKSKFDVVLNMFTSFGYFDTLEDDLMVIMAIKKSLKADGIGVIDFMNIDNVINTLVPQNSVDIDGVNFQIKRVFDGNFIRKSIQVKDGTETYNFEEIVRAYSHEDFKTMLSANGLQLINCFGSYDLQAFDPKLSSRLILIFKSSL
jgi:SAM-dependent methyltransferase